MTPRVSVCMPTWNRAPLLSQAIDSVLGQTMDDLELVVVDDGSTDDTAAVLGRVKDRRLRVATSPRREGIARTRNRCLAQARGSCIAWLDSDDLYEVDALETLTRALDRHPTAGFVHGAYTLIDGEGSPLPCWPLPLGIDRIDTGRDTLSELVLANFITTPTVLLRRDLLDRAGGFALAMGNNCEDWELWLRCALHTDFAYTARAVTRVRLHAASSSRADIGTGRRRRGEIAAVERFFARHAAGLDDAGALQRRAQAAIASRLLTTATQAMLVGRRDAAGRILDGLHHHAPLVVTSRTRSYLQRCAREGREFHLHTAAKRLFATLSVELAGTRFVSRLAKLASRNPSWEATSRHLGRVLSRVTAVRDHVAVIDKWDPTTIHHSGRRGHHFPDLRLLPGGYPTDSRAAIEHLEQLRERGLAFLAVPEQAFWWFQHYPGFLLHLEGTARRVWDDPRCVVFALRNADGAR